VRSFAQKKWRVREKEEEKITATCGVTRQREPPDTRKKKATPWAPRGPEKEVDPDLTNVREATPKKGRVKKKAGRDRPSVESCTS